MVAYGVVPPPVTRRFIKPSCRLRQVTSSKDQAQYWADPSKPYSFLPVTAFADAFQRTAAAQRTHNMLEMGFDKAASPEGALVRFSSLRILSLVSSFVDILLVATRARNTELSLSTCSAAGKGEAVSCFTCTLFPNRWRTSMGCRGRRFWGLHCGVRLCWCSATPSSTVRCMNDMSACLNLQQHLWNIQHYCRPCRRYFQMQASSSFRSRSSLSCLQRCSSEPPATPTPSTRCAFDLRFLPQTQLAAVLNLLQCALLAALGLGWYSLDMLMTHWFYWPQAQFYLAILFNSLVSMLFNVRPCAYLWGCPDWGNRLPSAVARLAHTARFKTRGLRCLLTADRTGRSFNFWWTASQCSVSAPPTAPDCQTCCVSCLSIASTMVSDDWPLTLRDCTWAQTSSAVSRHTLTRLSVGFLNLDWSSITEFAAAVMLRRQPVLPSVRSSHDLATDAHEPKDWWKPPLFHLRNHFWMNIFVLLSMPQVGVRIAIHGEPNSVPTFNGAIHGNAWGLLISSLHCEQPFHTVLSGAVLPLQILSIPQAIIESGVSSIIVYW